MGQDIMSQINAILGEVYYIIDLLQNTLTDSSRRALLRRLRSNMEHLSELIGLFPYDGDQPQGAAPVLAVQGNPRVFTASELASYNGKNGAPSYVAVNGIVYDVTNEPLWAAGMHFGLNAGLNHTEEFNTCHKQNVLYNLVEVGRLEDGSDALL